MLLPLAGRNVFEDLGVLDPAGWGAIAYLSLGCTIFAFALWAWLLGQLPATTAGFTVFLNPPLTVLSKVLLSALLPTVFIFDLRDSEWIGGLIVLTGMALALAGNRTPRAALAS